MIGEAELHSLCDMRRRYGALTAIGHACSNIMESAEIYHKSGSAEQRLWLVGRVGREAKRLAVLLAAIENLPLTPPRKVSQLQCNSR